MSPRLLCMLSGLACACIAAPVLRADVVDMQNGDRYVGKVISVSADNVVMDSEMLGRIKVPRKAVAHVVLGTNAVPSKMAPRMSGSSMATNRPSVTPTTALVNTNTDLSDVFRSLGSNTNFIQQVQEKMLLGNPQATRKYEELVGGLLSGELDMSDLRREAKSSADQLRALKQALGPDAGDSLDSYLDVLDHFLTETADESTNAAPAAQHP